MKILAQNVWTTRGRAPRARRLSSGFTLVELLVTITIIGVLAASLMHGTRVALESAKRASCASNLRALFAANMAYAAETGYYVPAAQDMMGANDCRWHGYRSRSSDPFKPEDGPLADYLDKGMDLRTCPSQRGFRHGSENGAFEDGCGGYGYNQVGVGSRLYLDGMTAGAYEEGMPPDEIADPAGTVMFCDTAFPMPMGSSDPAYLIEYSFCEPFHWVMSAGKESSMRSDPTIHFRHRGRANVVWCDGHVTSEKLAIRGGDGNDKFKLGWFGPEDNSLFDPF